MKLEIVNQRSFYVLVKYCKKILDIHRLSQDCDELELDIHKYIDLVS